MKLLDISYRVLVRLAVTALLLAGVSLSATAQEIVASGTVTDEYNQPLPGVSIRLADDPTKGVSTKSDGTFTLNCQQGTVLEFTFIGFTPIKLVAVPDMVVVMSSSAIALEEAVVVGVGYGTMRKSDLTGSISSVSQDELKQGVITSAEQLLQGKVAGLTVVNSSGDPSAGSVLRLRGGTSLSAGNSPLVVIDGIPGVDINTVQPSEILSIDILKDASSAAIYGSRGANGVIIITTNRSQSGKEMRSINYNGYFAISQIARHIDVLSANQWRGYVRENNLELRAEDYGANTDWQKAIERTAYTHSHNLSMSSVSAKSGYNASLTYTNSEGVIKKNKLNRLSGSVSGHQYGLNDRLRLDAGITGSIDQWNPIDNRIFERALNLNPTVPIRDENGNFTQVGGTLNDNPVELLTNRKNDDSRHRLLGYGKAELEIVDGLKANVIGSYEFNSYKGRYYVPTFAHMEGKTEGGVGVRSLAEYKTMQLEAFLTYEKNFADKHRLNLMAGYSYWENVYEGFGANRRGFDTDEFDYNNLAAGNNYKQGDVYSYKGESKLISFFGRVNYNYMDRYMVTATLRRDGSSKFGKDNKWGLFPSVSAAWRITEENFMKGTANWLDNLKLRLGFGITGNQEGIDSYKSMALLGLDGSSVYYDPITGMWKNAYSAIQNPNPGLKWESTYQYNVGLDFTLFNRVWGSIDLYHKKTKDLLWTYPVPQPPHLAPTQLANVGSLTNNGVELTLGSNILKIGDFSWDTNLTLAYNKQKINKLSNKDFQEKQDGIPAGSLHGLSGFSGIYTQYIREGYPVGSFFGPKALGIDENGEYIFKTDKDGNVVDEYLGSAQPKVTMGISMDFRYKNFDLNIAGYGMFGQKVLNATMMMMYDPTRLPSQNVPDKYIKSGIKGAPAYSSYWVEDASFFRLQSITLGYTLPFNLKKVGFNKIRVYATVENLFVITPYSGVDPEVSIELLDPSDRSKVGSPGVDIYNSYPRPRTISFGINLSF